MAEPVAGHHLAALYAYDLAPPLVAFQLAEAGTNNQTFGLKTGAGQLVVKRYRATRDRAALEYEHRLLTYLDGAGLSFLVPVPLPTRDGATFAHDGEGWLALSRLLPGAPPPPRDPRLAQQVGAALGELHATLAGMSAEPHPVLRSYADLDHVHPSVPDPAKLPIGDADAAWWRAELEQARTFVNDVYHTLPRQLTHGDFGPVNTLFEGERLVAVVDFEHAQPDARAIDVASGLSFVTRPWEGEAAWDAARAFCRGYRSRAQLTSAEIEALPELLRLRKAVSVVWRYGSRPEEGAERLARARATSAWLDEHGGRLVRVAAEEMMG